MLLVRRFAVIAVGGALGSWLRWRIAVAHPVDSAQFPTTTLVINLVGAALIGIVLVLFLDRRPPRPLVHSFLGTGVLGAFTTFSTFTVETAELLRVARPLMAAIYVVVSVVGGVSAALATMALTRLMLRGGVTS